jgi:hypothetical protein
MYLSQPFLEDGKHYVMLLQGSLELLCYVIAMGVSGKLICYTDFIKIVSE